MTVLDWLLDSDPSIRWQVMRDLSDEPADVVAAERARVATEGWGARLLDVITHDGRPAGDSAWSETPQGSGIYTMDALLLLRDMGLDPTSEQARRVVSLVRDNVRWKGVMPWDAAWHDRPFFSGEVEPCVNGRALASGAYFSEDMQEVVDRLLAEQLDDGGWNCDAPASLRSSFHTTICVLEGLLEHERTPGAASGVTEARARAQEYLLDRRMYRSLSSGEVIDTDWTLFSYPTRWHYDVLRGLDYLRNAGVEPDDRIEAAIDLVERNRGADGRWPLQNPHEDHLHLDMGEEEGQPSRWNTLRALRVLKWAGRAG